MTTIELYLSSSVFVIPSAVKVVDFAQLQVLWGSAMRHMEAVSCEDAFESLAAWVRASAFWSNHSIESVANVRKRIAKRVETL